MMRVESTIHGLLETAAERNPEALALVDDDFELSFSDWHRVSCHLAAGLQSMGVEPGDIVGVYVGKTFLLPCLFTAISMLGAQFMSLVPGWPEQTYERTFGRWPRKFVVFEEGFAPPEGQADLPTCWNLERKDVVSGCRKPDDLPEVDPADPVYLNITSASTGLPKVSATSHLHLGANTSGVCDALSLTQSDVHMSLFGVIGHPHEIFMRGLFLGGLTVLTCSPYPRTVIQRISNHRVSALMGLPPQLESISRLYTRADADLGSLRFAEAGGMCLPAELAGRFQDKTGAPVLPVWGSTETSGVALVGVPGEEGFTRVVPGYEIEIRETEDETGPEGTGELWVRGDGVVVGYHGDRAETQENFRDGWYRTGDIFMESSKKDERLLFLGRRGGLIKSAGLKVYPLEVELALLRHPDVDDACVVGAIHPNRGEVPSAFLVPRAGATLSPTGLRQFLRSLLDEHKIPRIFRIVPALPRTPNGKIDRKAVGKREVLPDYKGEILRTDVELVRLLNHRAGLLEALEAGFDPTWVQSQVENAVGHNPGPIPDSIIQEIVRSIINSLGKR